MKTRPRTSLTRITWKLFNLLPRYECWRNEYRGSFTVYRAYYFNEAQYFNEFQWNAVRQYRYNCARCSRICKSRGVETNKSDTSAGLGRPRPRKIFYFCAKTHQRPGIFRRDRKQLSRLKLACSSKLHAADMPVDREEQMFIYYHLSTCNCPRIALNFFNFAPCICL